MSSLSTLARLVAALGVVFLACGGAADHPIHVHGKLDIPQTYHWDLDNGALVIYHDPKYTPDVWYDAHSPGFQTLDPTYGAVLAIMGDKSAGYAGCLAAKLSPDPIDLGKLKKGTFICARTKEGRVAEFSYDELFAASPARPRVMTLEITYTTWEI